MANTTASDARKTTMHLKQLAVLLLSTTIVSLASDAPQTPAPAQTSQADFTLAISVKRPEYNAGAEVWVEIVKRNTSDHPVRVVRVTKQIADADRFYRTYVRDEKGNLAPETKHGRWIRTGRDDPGETTVYVWSGMPGTILPGASFRDEILLNRLYDISQPGKYTVQIEGLDESGRTAKSNTITIAITK
jgi:hypothetical protein